MRIKNIRTDYLIVEYYECITASYILSVYNIFQIVVVTWLKVEEQEPFNKKPYAKKELLFKMIVIIHLGSFDSTFVYCRSFKCNLSVIILYVNAECHPSPL